MLTAITIAALCIAAIIAVGLISLWLETVECRGAGAGALTAGLIVGLSESIAVHLAGAQWLAGVAFVIHKGRVSSIALYPAVAEH